MTYFYNKLNHGYFFVKIFNPQITQIFLPVRAGLGTINQTLLTIEALHKRDIQPAGIIDALPLIL